MLPGYTLCSKITLFTKSRTNTVRSRHANGSSFSSCSAIRGTRSSSVVTHPRPSTSSSLKTSNCSFRYASPHRWNQLPVSFRQPCTKHSADDVTLSNSSPTCSPLSPSITHSLFNSRLKTHLFHKPFPPQSVSTNLDYLLGLELDRTYSAQRLLRFLFIVSFLFLGRAVN